MTNTEPIPTGSSEPVEITLGGSRVRHLALVVVLRWSGEIDVHTIHGEDGRAFSLLEAAALLHAVAVDAGEAPDEDYPYVDDEGDWRITLDGQWIDNPALAIIHTHDGWQAAALFPDVDADRRTLTHLETADALKWIADNLEGELDADGRLALVSGL